MKAKPHTIETLKKLFTTIIRADDYLNTNYNTIDNYSTSNNTSPMKSEVIESQHTIRIDDDFITVSYMFSQSITHIYINAELVKSIHSRGQQVNINYMNIIEFTSTIYQSWKRKKILEDLEQVEQFIKDAFPDKHLKG